VVIAAKIESKNDLLAERVVALERENKILREELALLRQHMFGRRTERIEPGQLGLFSNESLQRAAAEAATALEDVRKPRGHGGVDLRLSILK